MTMTLLSTTGTTVLLLQLQTTSLFNHVGVNGFTRPFNIQSPQHSNMITNTRLKLGFMDMNTNTINTPIMQSSLVSDIMPSTTSTTLQAYSNATMADVVDFTAAASPKSSSTMISTQQQLLQDQTPSSSTSFLSSFLGYRLLLAAVACVYGTHFPLGSVLDQSLPPSAASSSRFFVAALALSPFISKLDKSLIPMALFGGSFTAMGYIAQSLALADTSPATVSFLGAATVIWCPLLEFVIHKQSMTWKDRPQVWIAGMLCLAGVGLLELFDGNAGGLAIATTTSAGEAKEWMGDGLALLQAVGFGTGIFMSEQMMKKQPQQALSITSVMVAVTAFWSLIWALCDGWMGNAQGWESMLLPNILMGNTAGLPGISMDDPFLLGKAVMWTGLISTSLNFFLEIFALGQVPPGEASVILATEPLWAAAFASIILGETMGWNDYAGGFLIVAACLISGAQASDIHKFLQLGNKEDQPQR